MSKIIYDVSEYHDEAAEKMAEFQQFCVDRDIPCIVMFSTKGINLGDGLVSHDNYLAISNPYREIAGGFPAVMHATTMSHYSPTFLLVVLGKLENDEEFRALVQKEVKSKIKLDYMQGEEDEIERRFEKMPVCPWCKEDALVDKITKDALSDNLSKTRCVSCGEYVILEEGETGETVAKRLKTSAEQKEELDDN